MSVTSRPGGAAASVREVTGDDWATLRDIRLEALATAPDAFGSTHAREAAFNEEAWRGRISGRSATFFGYAGPAAPLAGDQGGLVGLAGVVIDDGDADLVSMYVRPAGRGSGVAAALVDAVAEWARAHGYPALFLWVTESNTTARRLYERCGFTPTGDRQPLPSNPAVPEIRMRRAF